MHYPKHLQQMIEHLKKLPGVGGKTAERYAFQLLKWDPFVLNEFSKSLQNLHKNIVHCKECGALSDHDFCPFCSEERKSCNLLCVTATPKDVFAIEKTREFKGIYHVLGGLLSPMESIGPDQLSIKALKNRLDKYSINEIILAFDSTLEGDTTALFLQRELAPFSLKITRLAFGIPMGSSLDYVDGGTLARAFMGRESI